MTAGEGGLIVTSDRDLVELCESYIWGGRKIGRPWNEHHRLGWNYRLTEFQGAILGQQLKRLAGQNAQAGGKRARISTRNSPRYREFVRFGFDLLPPATRITFTSFASTRPNSASRGRISWRRFRRKGFRASPVTRIPCTRIPCSCSRISTLADARSPAATTTAPSIMLPLKPSVPMRSAPVAKRSGFEHRLLLAAREDMDDIVRAVEKIRDRASWI